MATVSDALVTAGLTSTLMPREVDERLSFMYANEAKLVRLIEYFNNKRSVENYKFEHLEQDLEEQTSALTADASATDATIAITSGEGKFINTGTVIVVSHSSTDTQHIVTSVSTDTLTISPVVPAGGYSSGDTVRILSNVIEENGTIGSSYYVEPSELYNYTQQFWVSWEVSSRMAKTKTYMGDIVKRRKDQMHKRFRRAIAKQGYWGQTSTGTALNSQTTTTTGGLKNIISSYATSGASVSESGFNTWVKNCTMKGSDVRYLFCGGTMQGEITGWKIADRVADQAHAMTDKLGFRVTEYINDYCRLFIVRDKIIDLVESDCAFLVDPENIGLAELQPKKIWKGIEDNGQLGHKGAITWDVGFDIRNEAAHGYMYSIS